MIGYEKLSKLNKQLKYFSKEEALKTLKRQKINIVYEYGEPLIPVGVYFSILEWAKNHVGISEIIDEINTKVHLTSEEEKEVYARIKKHYPAVHDWQCELFLSYFVPHYDVREKTKIISGILAYIQNSKEEAALISLSEAEVRYSIKPKRITRFLTPIHQGNNNGRAFVRVNDLEKIRQKDSEYIEISELLRTFCENCGFSVRPGTKEKLLSILRYEAYYGADAREESLFLKGPSVAYADKDLIIPYIEKKSIGMLPENKTNEAALESRLKKKYPDTYEFIRFAEETIKYAGGERYRILKFLNAELTREINTYEHEEVIELLTRMQYFSFSAEKKFESIIEEGRKHYKLRLKGKIRIIQEEKDESEKKNPYPYDSYVIMCGLVFNEEYWASKEMFRKICEDQAYANIVLYMQLHFASMWRRGDYLSTTKVELPENMDLEKAYNQILTGDLDIPELGKVVELFEYKNQKRIAHKNKQPLKICVPTSAAKYFACTLLVNEWHRRRNNQEFLLNEEYVTKYTYYEKLFAGHEDVFEGKAFSNLRACHSFADQISLVCERESHPGEKFICYLIISYARSHKGFLRQLPESTRHYLQAKTNGIELDEFLFNLFERGSFGFGMYLLLDVMLEAFYGLHVEEQTALMKLVNYKPYAIEEMIQQVDDYQSVRRSYWNKIFGSCQGEKEVKKKLLELMNKINRGFDEELCVSKKCVKELLEHDFKCERKGKQCLTCWYGLNFRQILYDLIDQKKIYDEMAENEKNENKSRLYRELSDNEIAPLIEYVVDIQQSKNFNIDTSEILQIFESAGLDLLC